MKKALLPVKRRLRCQRAVKGLCYGALAAGVVAAGVMAVSFFVPLPGRGLLLALSAGLAPLTALAFALLPVRWMDAARAADGCGLQERAQTALALLDRTDEMARLQREDAQDALQALDVRRSLPLRVKAVPLAAAGACLVLCMVLLFVANPQDQVLRAWERFQQQMKEPQEQLEALTKTLEEQKNAADVQELRRMLGELARKTAQARDTREALSAVSETQQKLEKWMKERNNGISQALSQAGLDAVAQAMNAAAGEQQAALTEALEAALAESDAAQLSELMKNAAESLSSPAAQQALQGAAQAISQGNITGAAQALGQMSASSAQIAAALQSVKAAAGMPGGQQAQALGQGASSGQGGQGQGIGQGQGGQGAGMGSTNKESGGGGGAGANGMQSAPHYKLGQYESIYDPTRLGDGGQVSQSTGSVGEQGDTMELTLSPGLGDASGSVPYDQVAGEYRDTAVQRAQEAGLPAYARDWINNYFSALTE